MRHLAPGRHKILYKKGTGVGILVIVGVLFGMILGQFFKCFVLFPAYGLAIVLVLASPSYMENSLLGGFFQFVVLTTSLQIGYVIGSVTSNFHRASKPLKNGALPLVQTRPSSNDAMTLPIATTGELLIDHTRPPCRAKRSLAVHR